MHDLDGFPLDDFIGSIGASTFVVDGSATESELLVRIVEYGQDVVFDEYGWSPVCDRSTS